MMSIDWLMENGGPVVRYRTQVELLNCYKNNLSEVYLGDVLAMPQVQKRLTLLKNLDYNKVHGSNSTYLENVLPMLVDVGLHYEIDAFRNEVLSAFDISKIALINEYDKIIGYPFLLQSGFPVTGMLEYVIERIKTIYDFTKNMDFAIYDNAENYKSVPKTFRDRPIIKPEIAYGNMCRLPLIYDIVAFAKIYDKVSSDMQMQIDNIINYIISPGYDVVVDVYGILVAPSRRYYSMGWDCKKPFNDNQNYSHQNIHRLLLYSHFPTAVKSTWFQNAIDYLMQFKSSNGTYVFPKNYLIEVDGYWVLGSRMSLAENRRSKRYLEVESSFYMQKLLTAQQTHTYYP
ncbi:MAG: hypothetical protein LBD23_04820 [Oscillospiraceae bacterium]|jgi:hypothetical protein|nr:hypothetical protein [Oscillospiraceae bacterium]